MAEYARALQPPKLHIHHQPRNLWLRLPLEKACTGHRPQVFEAKTAAPGKSLDRPQATGV